MKGKQCPKCGRKAKWHAWGGEWRCAWCRAIWGVNEDGTAWHIAEEVMDEGGWRTVPKGSLLVMESRDGAPGRTLFEVFLEKARRKARNRGKNRKDDI